MLPPERRTQRSPKPLAAHGDVHCVAANVVCTGFDRPAKPARECQADKGLG